WNRPPGQSRRCPTRTRSSGPRRLTRTLDHAPEPIGGCRDTREFDAQRRQGVVDRAEDRGRRGVDRALARSLDAEWGERRRCSDSRLLGHWHFVDRGQQVVHEGACQRLAVLTVNVLLEQRAAEPLRQAPLLDALDYRGVQARATVVGEDVLGDGDLTS